MHQPIRDNLEEYLKGSARQVPQEFHEHLKTCGDCARELQQYQAQSAMLQLLRPDTELDPRAGFYARVMDKIEQEGRSSIWSVLLQPNFGRRLAMASAVLVMLLGTYFVTSERSEPDLVSTDVVFTGAPSSAGDLSQDGLQQQRQRDAVLVNLAAYHE
jgi:predicted anti-sigma-YlaC factor YlaD